MWGNFLNVPPPNAPENQPPPAGMDPEELDDIQYKNPAPPARARTNRSTEFIYRETVEAILKDDNGTELKWLLDVLGDGVRVLNPTGRYVKSEPFLAQIRKQRKAQNVQAMQAYLPK